MIWSVAGFVIVLFTLIGAVEQWQRRRLDPVNLFCDGCALFLGAVLILFSK